MGSIFQEKDPKGGWQDPENFKHLNICNISPILSTFFVGMPLNLNILTFPQC